MAAPFGDISMDDILKPFLGRYSRQPLVVEGDTLVRAVEEEVPDERLFRVRFRTSSGKLFCTTFYVQGGIFVSDPVHLSGIVKLADLASDRTKGINMLGVSLPYNPAGSYELIYAMALGEKMDFRGHVLKTLKDYPAVRQ